MASWPCKFTPKWEICEFNSKMLLFYSLLAVLCQGISSQLVVNVKNKGGEIVKETIQANTTLDTITLDFQKSDGTIVTQFIDFKNEVHFFRVLVLGEEELNQPQQQVMCFVVRFIKNEFISSDAMSKLRQKNPNAIRHPEDEKGSEASVKDRIIDLEKSQVFSPFLSHICEDAKGTTYISDSDIRLLSRTLNKDYYVLLEATKAPSMDKIGNCKSVLETSKPCVCRYEVCVGWYPCGLKYCHGKDSSGKVVSYRCGIKTCRKCRQFDYYVPQKAHCMWEMPD